MSLKRPGTRKEAILPETSPLSVYATPAILVHQDTLGTLCPSHQLTRDQLYNTLLVAVAVELHCCSVIGHRIVVGYTFVYYVILKEESLRTRSDEASVTHEVAYCAIGPDCQDLSTLSSRQGLL